MRKAVIFLTILVMASPAFADKGRSGQLTMRPQGRQSLSHPIVYARLGYGATFAESFRTGPAVGFGLRGESDSFALDVSFANFVINGHSYDSGGTRLAGSFLRIEVLASSAMVSCVQLWSDRRGSAGTSRTTWCRWRACGCSSSPSFPTSTAGKRWLRCRSCASPSPRGSR